MSFSAPEQKEAQKKEQTLGQKIKALRLSRGLTLEDAGSILGCSKSTFAQWEHDRFKPKSKSIKIMAEHFGMPLEYFDFHESSLVESQLKSIEETKSALPQRVSLVDPVTGQSQTFKSDFFGQTTVSEAQACFHEVTSFENAPQVDCGDLMLCKKLDKSQQAANGLYILKRDDFYLVRYVMRSTRGKILLTTLAKGEAFSEVEEFTPEEFSQFELVAAIQNVKLNGFLVR